MALLVEEDCPVCEDGLGLVCFRRCTDGRTVVLLCDECGAVWLSPEAVTEEAALHPKAPRMLVPGKTCAVQGEGAGWATHEEVAAAGFSKFIFDEGPAIDED